MAIFTGFFDEGGHEHDAHFVMGGIALDVEKTAEFDHDWNKAIRDLPVHHKTGKPYLHTTDFMSGENDFALWKGLYVEKNRVLTEVAKVICKHSFRIFTCVLRMNDYADLNEELQLSEMLGLPYALLTRFSWELMRAWKYRTQFDDPVAMVLEDRIGSGDVYELFLNDKQPVPLSGHKTVCALQAADYVTWMRQQLLLPSGAFVHVRDTWKEINNFFHDDYTITRKDLQTICREAEIVSGDTMPTRHDYPQIQVRFHSNQKRPRPRFKSKLTV